MKDSDKTHWLRTWKAPALTGIIIMSFIVISTFLIGHAYKDASKALDKAHEEQIKEDEAWCHDKFDKKSEIGNCLLRLRESRNRLL